MDNNAVVGIVIISIFVVGVIIFAFAGDKKQKEREREEREREERERRVQEIERKREERERREREREQNILDHHGDWIKKFAERRFQGREEPGDMDKLIFSLVRKTPSLLDDLGIDKLVKSLVNQRIGFLEQEEFNEKILRLEPKDFKGCLDIFFHRYSNPSHNELGQFFRLVTEDSRFSPPCDLSDLNDLKRLLEEKKQDIEVEEFEKKLFQDSSNQDSSLDQRLVSIEDVDGMEGHDFESFLEKLFTEMGYYAEKTPGSGDQGADLILKKDGLTTVVQAKRSQSKISNKAVQEVLAGEKYYGADRLMVVTNHFFHESAKELAKRGSVELVDRNELESWIFSNPISDRG